MMIILIAALIGGLLGFVLYKRNPEEVEHKTKLGFAIWKLIWIPIYLLMMYTLIQSGGIIGVATSLIVTSLLVILILVFKPHKDIMQYRNQM